MSTKDILWKMIQAEAWDHSGEVIDEWHKALTNGLRALIRAWEAS